MGNNLLKDDVAYPGAVRVGGMRFVPMIGPDELRTGIAGLAGGLTARYADTLPLLVCVLNGAAIFHADLARMLPFPLQLDYIRVSSYQGGMESSGTIIFTTECSTQITGRHVIICEDIVDTGRTAERLKRYFTDGGAASVAVAALLYKREADLVGAPPEYVAFEIPDRFVIGFGLDYMQEGRNLPAVYVLDDTPPDEALP